MGVIKSFEVTENIFLRFVPLNKYRDSRIKNVRSEMLHSRFVWE